MRPTERFIATLAALFVLFTALLDPRASLILSAIFLLALIAYMATRQRTRKRN